MDRAPDPVVRAREAERAEEDARTRRALLHMLEDLQREQARLRQARHDWLGTVDAISDPMMVHDAELRVVRCNRAYAAQAGLDFPEILGRPYWECFPRRSGPLEGCLVQINEGASGVHETEIRLDSGEIFISRAYRVRDSEAGNVLHLFENVTEKRRVRKDLEASEARYRAMFDQAAVAMIQSSLDGTFMNVNPAFCKILGYSQPEFVGRAFTEFTHPDDRAMSAARKSALAGGNADSVAVFEKRYLRKDGSTVWASVCVAPVCDAAGKPEYFVTLVEDITERKRTQAALGESEARYRGIVESQADLIVRFDGEQIYTYVNNAFCAKYGLRREEVVGKKSLSFQVHPEDLAGTIQTIQALAQPPYQVTLEHRTLSLEGVRWIAWSGSGIRDGNGRVVEFQAIGRDITQRKESEQALAESEQKFRAIFSNTVDGIALFEIDARSIKYANEGMARLLGYAVTELEGMRLERLLQPDSAARVVHEFERGATGESKGVTDIPLLKKDGVVVFVDITGAPVEIGGRVFLTGSFRDATARRAGEAKLRAQVEELQRWQGLNLDREDRVVELKREVNELTRQLNQPPRYASGD